MDSDSLNFDVTKNIFKNVDLNLSEMLDNKSIKSNTDTSFNTNILHTDNIQTTYPIKYAT